MSEKENSHGGGNVASSDSGKQKFADFVRIHAIEANLISREDEKRILGKGITEFGLGFQEAHGIFLSVVSERSIALVSDADHHIEAFLEQMIKGGKIAKAHFEDAVSIYRRLTNGRIPENEIKKRVKVLMLEHDWKPRRSRWVIGSKRWFNKI